MLRAKGNLILKAAMLVLLLVLVTGFKISHAELILAKPAAKMKITSLGYKPEVGGGGAWTGGNLGKTWAEGEWVPYQLILADVGAGLAKLDSIMISFDFSIPHSGDVYRFVDLVRGVQVGTTPLGPTQAWPKPDGSAFPVGTRAEIEIAQNHPLENVWSHFSHLNLPNEQVNRTMSGGLDVPPGEQKHILKIYKSDLLLAGIDPNEDTVVIYYQLHESRTFIWQNRLQANYAMPPADVWGGYLYGTDSWDTVSVLGSGYVPGASGHVVLENPGSGQTIPIPIPESLPGTVSGLKWRDDNGNGVQDGGEPSLSGWQLHVSGTVEGIDLSATTHTDEFGNYSFPSLTAGTWTIKEDLQRDDPAETGYLQVYPAVGTVVGQGTGVTVGPPPPDAAAVGWEVLLTLDIPDQADMSFGNKRCDLLCDVTPDSDSVCVGSDAVFTASASGGISPYTYDWTGPAGFSASTATITISNVQPVNAGTYQVIVTDIYDCADTCYANLAVYSPPVFITVPEDDSVHAADHFVSTDFSTSGGKQPVAVSLCGVNPSPANQPNIVGSHVEWQTDCADDGAYTICLQATDACGVADTAYFQVTVYNAPPELTCPEDDSIYVGETLISGDFSATDPDGDAATVSFPDITPPAINDPTVVDNHIEWVTTSNELGDYVIRLKAADPCGLADTCEFTVTVIRQPPELSCPDDDTAHAGDLFVSTDFSYSYPVPIPVSLCGIDPAPVHLPSVVDNHVEWQTACADTGRTFTICLQITDEYGRKDTCYFDVTVINRPPELVCPEDDSVHAGERFVSTDFSVTDPDGGAPQVNVLDVSPTSVHSPSIVSNHLEWETTCSDTGLHTIRLEATDHCGLADTCEFKVYVYNQPPQLTCPADDSVRAGQIFTSTNFGVYDPESDQVTVNVLDIDPPATNNPVIVGDSAVSWTTTCSEDGDYVISLVAADDCQAKDTCEFTVTVYNPPPELTCPEDDSVHAGDHFVSTDFSYTDPGLKVSPVSVCGIDPPAAHTPYVVGSHVEWETECSDAGEVFTICLKGTDNCGAADTCYFDVTVYNRAPELTCPEDDSVYAEDWFTSTDFSVTDPDGGTPQVDILDVLPIPTYSPSIVSNHLEWESTCSDVGLHTIRLVATDDCGIKDTCEFDVTVYNNPPELTCPDSTNVYAGEEFESGDFYVSNEDPLQVQVDVLNIVPPATYNPYIQDQHVRWETTCSDTGLHTIRLEATDHCGLADTCEFKVYVYNDPPELTCPDSANVYAGDYFYSSDFYVSDENSFQVQVDVLGIVPSAVNNPYIFGQQVEWETTCSDTGLHTIRLEATDHCGLADTCEFKVYVYNNPPELTCPDSASVHAGEDFFSGDFSVSNENPFQVSVDFLDIVPSAANDPYVFDQHVEWTTTCSDTGLHTIRLEATDHCGLADTCEFKVYVYNQPPQLTCPADDSVRAGQTFNSGRFDYYDAHFDPVTVNVLDIDPPATNNPVIVGDSAVSWTTTCSEDGDYVIRLVAADFCQAKDTCEFTVTVYNPPPELTCPEDDSVHAGDHFVSTDFSYTDPGLKVSPVSVCGIDPPAAHTPYVVGSHVEWDTECSDTGKVFTICLKGTDNCGAADTCYFDVTVYNRAPELTCPEDDSVYAGDWFTSTDFSVTDPDGETPQVDFLDILPPATYSPYVHEQHVGWETTCSDTGLHTIRLVATDDCGVKDTCEFDVTVYNNPPELTCPDSSSVHAGDLFMSGDFSVSNEDPLQVQVDVLDIVPPASYNPYVYDQEVRWETTCSDTGLHTIRLEATDHCGLADTCEFKVYVYNQPPQLTCPADDSVRAGQTLTSDPFQVSDPESDQVTVNVLDVDPPATNNPVIVGDSAVSWTTTCSEDGDYVIRLVAADDCQAKDTCEFTVTVYNPPPQLTCPEDDSVHAGDHFVSTDFSYGDPGLKVSPVSVCGIDPPAAHTPYVVGSHVEWETECSDAGEVFTICLKGTDNCGAADTCYFDVTVYNRPPELTCPELDTVVAGESFVSTDFSASDPDGDTPQVDILDINPSATNDPTIAANHVEWLTTLSEDGDYLIRLVATDPCQLTDTCEFTVIVIPPPEDFICPDDDTVHAGEHFVSTDFYYESPFGPKSSVSLCGVDPAPVHLPAIVEDHVEWQTECDDAGKVFTICLEATDDYGRKDTCYFDVLVYNRPPELTCPEDDQIPALEYFISTDFSATDPDGDSVTVTFLDIDPAAANDPAVVGCRVEWATTLAEVLGSFDIRLVATDPCGLADTCEFNVIVDLPTGDLTCPENDSIHAGQRFVSTNFSLTGPGAHPSLVSIVSVDPAPANMPIIVASHVEWQTSCLDVGKVFTICLKGPVPLGEDSCCFEVTVYNRPPQLFCPEDGQVFAGDLFVSTDFRTFDPDGDRVGVSILDIEPCPCTNPYIVRNHLEWQTTCCDTGTFYIRLVGTDPCGLKDTCGFWVSISYEPPPPDFYFWIIPATKYVTAGQTAQFIVELHSMHGFHSPCSLYVSGLPNPPNSADFNQAVVTPTGWTVLNVHTSGATPPGWYILTITGKEIGGSVQHDVVVFLEVGSSLLTDVDENAIRLNTPGSFALFQNRPNPFNPETEISFALPEPAHVSLIVYNIQGQKVATLASDEMGVGIHTVRWNGRDESGNRVASGVYFCRMQTRQFNQTMRMVLMK